MKRALAALACTFGWDAVVRRRQRDRLLILMYHGVVEQALRPFCWHQLPLAAFCRQMSWVGRHFRVLPLVEALERLEAGSLPPNACALTFDDGYRNVRTLAEPVLRTLGLSATVFLPTETIDTGGLLWPDRVHSALAAARAERIDLTALGLGTLPLANRHDRSTAIAAVLHALKALPQAEKDERIGELVRMTGEDAASAHAAPFALLDWEEVVRTNAGGVLAFGPHSTTHEILSRCSDEEVRAQILGSCAAVTERLGERPRVFAYPNGRAVDFDERCRDALREAGVPWALSTEHGHNGAGADRLALRRTSVGSDLPWAYFKLLASGWG